MNATRTELCVVLYSSVPVRRAAALALACTRVVALAQRERERA